MKKKYISPEIRARRIQFAQVIASSFGWEGEGGNAAKDSLGFDLSEDDSEGEEGNIFDE